MQSLDPGEFLEINGLSEAVLVDAIGEAFGPPRLAALAGSVSIGFGNAESDIDVFAVVDDESVSPLPIPTYVNDRRIDVRFISTSTVQGWTELLGRNLDPAPVEALDRDRFMASRYALEHATRLSLACPLPLGDLQIDEVIDRRAVQEAAAAFWLGEAARHWFAGVSADGGRRRDFVRLRVEETVLALLEAEAARLGEHYFGTKWLGEKLRRQKLDGLADSLRRLIDPRRSLEDLMAEAVSHGIDSVLAGSSALGSYRVVVLPAPDVAVYDVLGRRMVVRWGMRGAWVPEGLALDVVGGALPTDHRFWAGQPHERPPAALQELIEADLCWIAIERTGE